MYSIVNIIVNIEVYNDCSIYIYSNYIVNM